MSRLEENSNTIRSVPVPAAVSEGLKCSICKKSFEQRSSRDRHLRRCRQKQLTGAIPRKKSCALCTQAKTRCDLRTPACSRCKTKGLDCHYYSPPVAHRAPVPASPPEEYSLPTPAATDSEQLDDAEQETSFNNNPLGDAANIVDWGEISNSLLDWAPMFGNIVGGGTGISADQGAAATAAVIEPEKPPDSNCMPSPGGGMKPASCMNLCTPEHTSVHHFRAAAGQHQPSRLVSVESFIHMRHRLTTQPTSEVTNFHFNKFGFLNRVMRSYPKMMVAGNVLPPFVHPTSLIPGKIPEALANCRGLVEMYRSMTPENKNFVMKTIIREQERVLTQYISCSDAEMLSMLQAALIYGLIRHFENDPTMDRSVLMQIETIAFNVGLGGLMARGEVENTRPVWEEWVLAESKRRTLLTMYMFDASFHQSRGLQTLTSQELGDLPLPAIRTLWEGTDRAKWEFEYERYLSELKGARLPRVLDAWPPGDITLLDEWSAGMDSFGVTVLALCQNCPVPENHMSSYLTCQNRRGGE